MKFPQVLKIKKYPQKKKSKTLIWIVGVVAVLVLAGIFGSNEEDISNPNQDLSSAPTISSTFTEPNAEPSPFVISSGYDVIRLIAKQPIALPNNVECSLMEGFVTRECFKTIKVTKQGCKQDK